MHDHTTQIIDTDPKFEIDIVSRKIINNSGKTTLMRYDHNSERFGFSMPRFIDSHDMSEVDRIEIHYINTDVVTSETSTDKYTVEDLAVDAENSKMIHFSWKIRNTATKYKGALAFLIRFLCFDGDKIDYSWSTEPFKTLTVGEGFECTESFSDETLDQLEAWKKEIKTEITTDIGDKNNLNTIDKTSLVNAINEVLGLSVATRSYVDIKGGSDNWIAEEVKDASDNVIGYRYGQEVEVINATITANSKVDLQITSVQMVIFYEKDLAFVTENDNGVVTVYCVGNIPENDYRMQAIVTEVV